MGKRLLRVLQCTLQGRTSEWGSLLHPQGSTNHHRTMEEALQHHHRTQCFGLLPASPRSHHLDGPKTSHALTFKLDQLTRAGQFSVITTTEKYFNRGVLTALQTAGHISSIGAVSIEPSSVCRLRTLGAVICFELTTTLQMDGPGLSQQASRHCSICLVVSISIKGIP